MVRRLFAIFLFAVIVVPAMSAPAGAQDKGFVAVNPPQPVPPFLFEDRKGHSIDLKEFRGRYVLLNLWATFCQPCVEEMPTLNDLSKRLDIQKIAVIALSEDHDGLDVARGFFQRHRIDRLNVYNDPTGRAPFVLEVRGLPTTLLINPEGLEIARLEGPADWTTDSITAFLKAQMAH